MVFSSCGGKYAEVPTFEDSNAYLIKKSVESISLADSIAQFIDQDDKVVFVSIERDKTDDHAIPSLIEDVFIEQLVDRGYQVLERDDNLVYRLMAESDSAYTYMERIRRKASSTQRSAAVTDPTFLYPPEKYGNISTYTDYEHYNDHAFYTSLYSADKIIAYRILESGILYERIYKKTESDTLHRIADTILHLRIEDAKTGEILNVSEARGTVSDTVRTDDMRLLENYHMHFYRFGYPVTYGNQPQVSIAIEKEQAQASNATKIVGGIIAAVAITGIVIFTVVK